MTRTEIVMQAMTPDELDALIRDAEAERERRKVKPCVRRMEDLSPTGVGLFIDDHNIVDVWAGAYTNVNIDHATAKRQIALAFCMVDWLTRANKRHLNKIEWSSPLMLEFCWLVSSVEGRSTKGFDEAARAAGWIK